MVLPRRACVLLANDPDMEGELWVLYADSTVAIIQISEILGKLNSAVFGPAQASKFRKYSLRDPKDIVAAVPCGPVRPTIFQSHLRLGVYTLVSAGSAPFLAFYQAGNDQNSIIHLAHIATTIASRAAGTVWSFATSWGWGEDQESMHLERGKERDMLNTLNLAQVRSMLQRSMFQPQLALLDRFLKTNGGVAEYLYWVRQAGWLLYQAHLVELCWWIPHE
ncbi:hypothetical protein DVH05_000674 [Phytophthora capsici]|nr:hypothetical protein DVH05_000674 [Phytophthora capsici]